MSPRSVVKSSRQSSGIAQAERSKEEAFKALSALLTLHGIVVRREELKRGPGWRVMSGGCRVDGKAVLFVDRRVSLEEQLDIVVERVRSLGLAVPEETLELLPPTIRRHLDQLSESSPSSDS